MTVILSLKISLVITGPGIVWIRPLNFFVLLLFFFSTKQPNLTPLPSTAKSRGLSERNLSHFASFSGVLAFCGFSVGSGHI